MYHSVKRKRKETTSKFNNNVTLQDCQAEGKKIKQWILPVRQICKGFRVAQVLFSSCGIALK